MQRKIVSDVVKRRSKDEHPAGADLLLNKQRTPVCELRQDAVLAGIHTNHLIELHVIELPRPCDRWMALVDISGREETFTFTRCISRIADLRAQHFSLGRQIRSGSYQDAATSPDVVFDRSSRIRENDKAVLIEIEIR